MYFWNLPCVWCLKVNYTNEMQNELNFRCTCVFREFSGLTFLHYEFFLIEHFLIELFPIELFPTLTLFPTYKLKRTFPDFYIFPILYLDISLVVGGSNPAEQILISKVSPLLHIVISSSWEKCSIRKLSIGKNMQCQQNICQLFNSY